ncbi:MFS transporter [Gryllotalpicola daejeonensis]|uniref:MFS transporter n=1 Tax=Gryllotalpicola daejeonensis TaxID=993087 RepID=A0ABP7ZKU7_9MICO
MPGRAAGAPTSRRLTGVLVALCATVVTSYGALFYAFAVLAPSIAGDTGWSQVAITTAFSVASLAGAACGIPVGRMLQRFGPRPVMVFGSALGAASVAVMALAPDFAIFACAWALIGVATAGLYYAPAFAALTAWFGARRVRAITTLTLAGGFASTIFAPFTAFLDGRLGWRGSYLVLAGILLVVTLPAHAIALRLPWQPQQAVARAPDRDVLGSPLFVLMASAGTVTAFVSYASLVALPVLLLGRGAAPALAAWAVGLAGAGQVGGRLVYPLLDHRLRPRTRAAFVFGLLAASLLAQSLVTGPEWLSVAIAVVGGAARGLFTLVNATLPAELWGPERYPAISGVYQAPLAAAGGLAPGAGAAIAAVAGGYPALFEILAALAAVAVVIALAPGRAVPRPVSASNPRMTSD